jgi:hypothetical protein
MHTRAIYFVILALAISIVLGVPLGSKSSKGSKAAPVAKKPTTAAKSSAAAAKPPVTTKPPVAKSSPAAKDSASKAPPASKAASASVSKSPPVAAKKSTSAVTATSQVLSKSAVSSTKAAVTTKAKTNSTLSTSASVQTSGTASIVNASSTASAAIPTSSANDTQACTVPKKGGKGKRCTDPITLNGNTLNLTPLGTGTRGEVFDVTGGFKGQDAVAKRSKTGASLAEEDKNSKAAGARLDSGTASDGNFYIILKKIPGVPLSQTKAAQEAREGGQCAFLMASARNLIANKALQYASPPTNIKHGDLALSNAHFLEGVDEDDESELQSVDFLDWGEATRTAAGDANSFKLQIKQTLEGTLGFRDQDCENNWAGIPL